MPVSGEDVLSVHLASSADDRDAEAYSQTTGLADRSHLRGKKLDGHNVRGGVRSLLTF